MRAILIPYATVSYDTFIDFIGHYSKRERHKYKVEVEKRTT